jgi:hypothetical protein
LRPSVFHYVALRRKQAREINWGKERDSCRYSWSTMVNWVHAFFCELESGVIV